MLRLPHLPRGARWLVIVWAGAVFLWISLEDHQTLPVALLGTGCVVLFAVVRLLQRFGGAAVPARLAWLAAPLIGGLVGAASAVAASLLMFMKTAIHAHVFPDYPYAQIIAMLQLAPTWLAAGALIGLGLLFVYQAVHHTQRDE